PSCSSVLPPLCLIPPSFPSPIQSSSSNQHHPNPLVLACSISTLACYIFLLIPPSILPSPLFSVICFAFGYGPAPLLLVIIAPFFTEHVSTALGVHKALEMAGSTIMQMVFPPSIPLSLYPFSVILSFIYPFSFTRIPFINSI